MKLRHALPWLLLTALLLVGCAASRTTNNTTPGSDTEFVRVSRLARAAYNRGALAQAETLYRQAHRSARALDAAAELADASYNLAAVLMARGRAGEAKPLLDEAEAECLRVGQTPTDVWLVKAKLAVSEEKLAAALRWIDAVNKSPRSSAAQRAEAALLHGEVACLRNDVNEAHAQLEAARRLFNIDNPMLAAGVERLSGRVALLEARHAAAAAAYDRESDYCRRAGQRRAMAHALARAGEAFAHAGDPRAGAERSYRAARSFLAQSDALAAKPVIQRGLEIAALAGDELLQARLRQLAEEAGQP